MLETMIVPSKLDHDAWRKLDHLKHQYMFACCRVANLIYLLALLLFFDPLMHLLSVETHFCSTFPIHEKIWLNVGQHAQVLRDILDIWWFRRNLQSPGILYTDIHLLASWMVELIFVQWSESMPNMNRYSIRRKQLLCFVYRLNLAGEYCISNFDITLIWLNINIYIYSNLSLNISTIQK